MDVQAELMDAKKRPYVKSLKKAEVMGRWHEKESPRAFVIVKDLQNLLKST
jgi:hypothetical protein